jgi:hypothetical protein
MEVKNMNIHDFIYDYEVWQNMLDGAYWGDKINHPSVEGPTAFELANKEGIKIVGGEKLLPNVYYVFRWNLKRTQLIPARVSMHPKTYANIAKGSRRYGSGAILSEIR